ncbi:MAG: hypothetical protein Q8904_15645 [Bacteroidota bacterium]|nr:hypothetical protein [Bacteroidota bacterium]
MKTIIETTLVESEKSNFLIDLVKHDSGLLYIEIVQTIVDSKEEKKSIKINPFVISDIIKVLQNYQAKISTQLNIRNKHITDLEQIKVQDLYLKGVPIKDLALQFDQTPELIEMILRNKGIEIVNNKLSRSMFWRKNNNWRKRKR